MGFDHPEARAADGVGSAGGARRISLEGPCPDDQDSIAQLDPSRPDVAHLRGVHAPGREGGGPPEIVTVSSMGPWDVRGPSEGKSQMDELPALPAGRAHRIASRNIRARILM